jgi:hypothetical protein
MSTYIRLIALSVAPIRATVTFWLIVEVISDGIKIVVVGVS